MGNDPDVLRASLLEIRTAWGDYEGSQPAVATEQPPNLDWLADDEYAVLEEKGLVAATAIP